MSGLVDDLVGMSNEEEIELSMRFFKTGKGEYGEGDKFLGINAANTKMIAKKYKEISLKEVEKYLQHKFHEVRVVALLIMIDRFAKTGDKAIYDMYLRNVEHINNWDLVDISAHKVVGKWSWDNKNTKDIVKLSETKHLWSERVSVVSTWYFIKKGDYDLTLSLCKHFINHKHDLMHKACGWMLREVGKMDEKVLLRFLDEYHKKLPRTSLRYSIERLSKEQKKHYMAK